jgi:hypothetical protein
MIADHLLIYAVVISSLMVIGLVLTIWEFRNNK